MSNRSPTPVLPRLPRALQEEAALRYAQSRSDRFSAEARQQLETWLAADPAHARAFAQAHNAWQAARVLRNDPELLALARRPRRQARWAMAASLLVASLCAGLFWHSWQGGQPQLHATQPWEQRSVQLADGSTARLSAGTQVSVRIEADERYAQVHRGEAIFDVTPDPERPFRVQAGDALITVIGTRFQVRHEAGRVAVTLLEGEVHLSRSRYGYEQLMVPGQQVAFAAAEPAADLREVDVEAVTAWSRDQLVFRDAPLAEALREANRHADLQLILRDPSLGDVPVNGQFRLGDNESLLAAVQSAFPVRAERLSETRIELTRN